MSEELTRPYQKYLFDRMVKIANYYDEIDERFFRSVRILIKTTPVYDSLKRRVDESYQTYIKQKTLILTSNKTQTEKLHELIQIKNVFFEIFFNLYCEAIYCLIDKGVLITTPYKLPPLAKTPSIKDKPAKIQGRRKAR